MSDNKQMPDEYMDDEIVYEDEATPRDQTKKLREKLAKAVSEKQEYLDGWQRAKADLVNAKKRIETEKQDFARYATQNFILELLPILDSFDMAFKDQKAWNEAPEGWRKGIEYIYTQFMTTLQNHGITALKPLGEAFNPHEHDSIESVPVTDPKQDHTVVEVVMTGYKLGDKIIRPAKVKVGTVEN